MPRQLSNFLVGYRDYTSTLESPDSFHIWTALSLLSACTKRQIWLDQGFFQIYPNLYLLLVAPPGTCRKSQAMQTGREILDKVPGMHVEANTLSPESLILSLSNGGQTKLIKGRSKKTPGTNVQIRKTCTGVIYSSEFTVTVGKDAANNGMLALLADLFDCPKHWKKETISRGLDEINNCYLTIFGATTPKLISTSIPDDAVGGGLMSRIIIISEAYKRLSNPRPKMSPRLLKLRDDLINDLTHISMLSGEISMTPEAETFYDAWYNALNARDYEERFWGYAERKPLHMLKIAMLLSIAESDKLILTEAHLKMSLELLARAEKRMPSAFSQSGNPTAKDIYRITEQLMVAGGCLEYEELLRRNIPYLTDINKFDLILSTMVRLSVLEACKHPVSGRAAYRIKEKADENEGGDGNNGDQSTGGATSATTNGES